MFALRYAVLLALVLWVGGMVTMLLGGAGPDLLRFVHRFAPVCGGIVFLGLVAIKLLGPPPYAFSVRAAVAGVMLAIAGYEALPAGRAIGTMLDGINTVAGFFLLSFYVRE